MNSLTLKNSIFHGKCWCPKANEELVLQTLHNLSKKQPHIAGGQIQETMRPEHVSPPTYFKSNQFTNIFQEIVNTYGIPRYREINPTVFTIITFPFLFGVMFGDIAHGFLVFILGLYLMFWKQGLMKSDSIFKQLVPGRHLIVLMGFFSFYCGLMYNDFLYLSLDLFGSCYQVNTDVSPVEIMKKDGECVYPIGLDPVWVISNQDINFTNSYKMKLAVILGVIHMSFGIFLKALNTIHEQKPMDFFFEFIPQIIFMIFTFGYMIILIFLKWGIDWQPDLFMAPSIINIMIDIPLKMGTTENRPIWGDLIGIEQEEFQKAIICILIVF
jgi:V-type H+-transporting ATPase subunit a